MTISRFLSVLVLAQGVSPVVVLSLNHSANLASVGAAVLYILLAFGLWGRQGWALPLGAILTLPQLLIFSTWAASWCCFVGITAGLSILPEGDFLQGHFHPFLLLGMDLHASDHYNPRFLSPHGPETAWLGLNLWAAWVLYLLGRLWFARRARPQTE